MSKILPESGRWLLPSMAGLDYIDVRVLNYREKDNHFLIAYYDKIANENHYRWVDKKEVKKLKYNIFKIPMIENYADANTIGEYFSELLLSLWDQGEGFSGKRPFGNSDWKYEVYASLIKASVVKGKIDEYDCILEFDDKQRSKADKLIFDAISKNMVG